MSRYNIYKKFGVLVLSEKNCVEFKPEPDTVLIRIQLDFFKRLKHKDEYVDILECSFDDVDLESQGKVIGEDDIRAIVAFFDKHRGRKMVIHCLAGISRSSATACAWAQFNGLPECEEEIRQTSCFVPNARVYRELMLEIDRRERLGI